MYQVPLKLSKLILYSLVPVKLCHVMSFPGKNVYGMISDGYQSAKWSFLWKGSKSNFTPLYTRLICTSAESLARHKYHPDCEHAVNQQILAELNAAYAYLSMASYFGRTEVALPGCYGFFLDMHQEEMEHAMAFLKYQNLRGGKVHLYPITSSECTEWDIEKALKVGLEMEKLVKEKLICVHDCAELHHDLNLMDMIVTDFIAEQERSICEFGRLLSRFNSMRGCGTCSCVEYLFDKELHETFVRRAKKDCEDPKKSTYK